MFWDCFHKIFSFEYDDVRFARDKLGLSVEYVPVGTNYNFYKVAPICKPEYDICFVYNGLIVKTKNKVFYNEPICM
jgi:hypothetical protein